MKTLNLAALAVTIIFGTALANAQETEHEIKMQIIVTGDGSDGENVINWTSNDPNIDLQNMQIGESQAIVDDSGRSILVTKEAEGLRFDIDGESIVIPDFGEMENVHGTTMAFVSADGMQTIDHDIDVQIIGAGHAMASSVRDGVMIITSEPLDASTQETIRSVLLSAGNDDDVTFIDGSDGGSGPHVKVLRKTIEIKN